MNKIKLFILLKCCFEKHSLPLCQISKYLMTKADEINNFLKDFKTKMEIWGIVFMDDRAKNTKTLSILELNTIQRRKILSDLQVVDYSEGPIIDKQFFGNDLWVFGKTYKNQALYIKITMGNPNKQTICISFHIAEYPMKFPLKTN